MGKRGCQNVNVPVPRTYTHAVGKNTVKEKGKMGWEKWGGGEIGLGSV